MFAGGGNYTGTNTEVSRAVKPTAQKPFRKFGFVSFGKCLPVLFSTGCCSFLSSTPFLCLGLEAINLCFGPSSSLSPIYSFSDLLFGPPMLLASLHIPSEWMTEKQNWFREGTEKNLKWKTRNFQFSRQDHRESVKRSEVSDGVAEEDTY